MTFSSAAGAAGLPVSSSTAGRASSSAGGLSRTARRASSTSRAICKAATSSPAVIVDALTAGSPSRRDRSVNDAQDQNQHRRHQVDRIAPAQLGMKSPA